MGDEQHRHFSFELVDGDGEVLGGGAVQAAGGFIEDENFWLLEQSAGNGDALLLSAGKTYAAFANFGLVALRQGFDGAVDFRHFPDGPMMAMTLPGATLRLKP